VKLIGHSVVKQQLEAYCVCKRQDGSISNMSSELDQARLMAERIARRVAASSSSSQTRTNGNADITSELSAMRASLRELQDRLLQIESKVRSGTDVSSYSSDTSPNGPRTHSPWLAGVNANHPSQERFGVEEATVSELVDYFQSEKTCSVEPGGKPCDHCSMCSSRGF
jgi:hypothetical protein